MEQQERYRRGWEKLKEIDGKAGERVIESLQDIAPDFARYLIEFSFGDIYSRPALDLKSREIAVVAALTALGNAIPPTQGAYPRNTQCWVRSPGSGGNSHANGGVCRFSRNP